MSKTLHTKSSSQAENKKTATIVQPEKSTEQLTELMQDMKGAWQSAAADLMQPRPEAVAQLLKKVLH